MAAEAPASGLLPSSLPYAHPCRTIDSEDCSSKRRFLFCITAFLCCNACFAVNRAHSKLLGFWHGERDLAAIKSDQHIALVIVANSYFCCFHASHSVLIAPAADVGKSIHLWVVRARWM